MSTDPVYVHRADMGTEDKLGKDAPNAVCSAHK
jgi:hypothetical protein